MNLWEKGPVQNLEGACVALCQLSDFFLIKVHALFSANPLFRN